MKKFLLLLALVGLTFAQHDHSDDGTFVEEGAHVHGVANLQVVVDGDALLLDFTTPAINLIGFEYEPKDEAEIAAVEDAIASLIAGDSLFVPNRAASCSLVSATAQREAHEHHHHEPLFAEDGGVNADHPAKHVHHGPMKSIIALPSPEGNEDGLLYHAGGTHIRYDVIMLGGTAYFEYHALQSGDYVFFTENDSLEMHIMHDDALVGAEMVVSGSMLHQEEDVFAKAFVFELEEGVHIVKLDSASADFSFVAEARHHDDEHAHEHHDDHHDDGHHDDGHHAHEGEEGAHADEAAHSHDMHEGHDHEDGAEHSDFLASYEFSCSNIDKLDSLDLSNLFELYSGIEDLDVQYVLPTGQGADELNAAKTTLNF